MITFRPIGRLGNNLFQAAACIGYAKAHNTQWAIPQRRGGGDTDPWLMPGFWPNLLTCYGASGDRYEQHDPAQYDYKPIPNYPGDVTLVGFFQSEKWFKNAKEEVREAFKLKHYPEYEGYVSIHVRRGDYVTYSDSFPPITKEYLYESMFSIWEKTKTTKFLIFSDDIQWCKGIFNVGYKIMVGYPENVNLSTEKGDFTFEFNEDQNEFDALSKMASCSHHIIANSSFSWWGAWLGHNPTKIVVAPHHTQWYGSQNGVVIEAKKNGVEPCRDLIPETWIQVKI